MWLPKDSCFSASSWQMGKQHGGPAHKVFIRQNWRWHIPLLFKCHYVELSHLATLKCKFRRLGNVVCGPRMKRVLSLVLAFCNKLLGCLLGAGNKIIKEIFQLSANKLQHSEKNASLQIYQMSFHRVSQMTHDHSFASNKIPWYNLGHWTEALSFLNPYHHMCTYRLIGYKYSVFHFR